MKLSWLRETTRTVLPSICIYSGLNLALGFFYPYQNLQARSLGLTVTEIMNISGIIPLITFYSSPLVGYIGDKMGHKMTLIICLVLTSLNLIVYTLLPKYKSVPRFKIGVNASDEDITADSLKMFGEYLTANTPCRDQLDFTIQDVICDGESVSSNFSVAVTNFFNVSSGHCEVSGQDFCTYDIVEYNANEDFLYCDVAIKDVDSFDESGSKTVTFWTYLAAKFIWGFVSGPSWVLSDSIAITASKAANIDWGYVNFFGAISAVIAPLLTGFLIDSITFLNSPDDCITQQPGIQKYQMPFYSAAIGCFVLAIYVCFIRVKIEKEENKKKVSFREEFSWILKAPPLCFYLTILVDGYVFGVIDGFYAFFLVDELGISQEWLGILFALGPAVAIVSCLVAGFLHNRYVGSMNLVIFGGVLKCLKIIVVSFSRAYGPDEVPYLLLFSTLFEFGQFVGIVGYVKLVAPKDLTATAMGFASILEFVVGKGLGMFLGSQLNIVVGMKATLYISGFIGLGYNFLFFFFFHAFIRDTESYKEGVLVEKSVEKSGDKSNAAYEEDADDDYIKNTYL